jgi:hypothetical protein
MVSIQGHHERSGITSAHAVGTVFAYNTKSGKLVDSKKIVDLVIAATVGNSWPVWTREAIGFGQVFLRDPQGKTPNIRRVVVYSSFIRGCADEKQETNLS